MRTTIRGRWHGLARLLAALFTAAPLLVPVCSSTAASVARSAKKGQASSNVIIVNRLAGELSSDGMDLAQAIVVAGRDPRDNIIEFDDALFAGACTMVLSQPIVIAANSGNDVIRGPAGEGASLTLDATACVDAGIIVGNTGSMSLANLTIKGGHQRAILLKDKSRVTLDNVVIRGHSGPGMALFGGSQANLKKCLIIGTHTHGIEVHGDSVAHLNDVQIEDSGQSGMAGFDRASLIAESCRLYRNGHWNLVLTGQSRAQLDSCALAGARFANADISDASRLDIRGCTIEQGGQFGVFATGRSVCNVVDSAIRRQGNRGIEMQDNAGLHLANSEIDANGDYGLILFERCQVRAVDTKFTRNAGHGVSLRGKAGGEFERCLFEGNRYSGIGCLDSGDGGLVRATQCTFRGNGMRPIYRGPLHLDPMVPTPLMIDTATVTCIADRLATIELYLDRAGEASRYLRTIKADAQGRFRVSRSDVPAGWVMTAAATADGATSEFNVVAGDASPEVIGALLARTGPLSDTGGRSDLDGGLRRWRTGTQLIMYVPNPPSEAVERYSRFIADHVADWTQGAIHAEVSIGAAAPPDRDAVIVPVQYMPSDSAPLLGRGGVTYMRWDAQGYFVVPMKILLASGKDPAETCPRVLAHEFGHVLGLCHVRVGLLSRMQGSVPPTDAFVNDFSPMFTFYDVLALHTLHSSRLHTPATLRQVVAAGALPPAPATEVVSLRPNTGDNPSYSPSPSQHEAASPRRARRP